MNRDGSVSRPTLENRDGQNRIWDVIVIGAGVAGAVAARQAALAGHRVLLIDKRQFPRRKVCGACLNQVALDVFQQLGLSDVIAGLGGTDLNRFSLHCGRRTLQVPLPAGIALSRETLDETLIREAVSAGVEFLPETMAKVGEHEPGSRDVKLQQGGLESLIKGRCVVVATGLESVSSHGSCEWTTEVVAASRVGAGCVVEGAGDDYSAGTIWMAAGTGGYTGLVRVEGGRLNVAAAFDRDFLRAQGSPARAASAVLEQARMPVPQEFNSADWQGTIQLTRTTRPVASHRVFLIGDAAGYVEPFTGEGMAWGLLTAQHVIPWVSKTVAGAEWSASIGHGWGTEYGKLIDHRQKLCRRFAWFLRSPTLISMSLSVGAVWPRLAHGLVKRLNASG